MEHSAGLGQDQGGPNNLQIILLSKKQMGKLVDWYAKGAR